MYEISIAKMKVKYKGEIDIKKMYKMINGIFLSKNYKVIEEKVIKEETSTGITILMTIKLEKELDSYSKSINNVEFNIYGYNEIETFEGGVKSIKGVGEAEFVLSPVLQLDYKNQWEEGILSGFRSTFENYYYKEKIDNWKKVLWLETEGIRNDVKSLLD